MPGVSFVVPVYNKAPYLVGVLAAIRAQRGDFEREYVFVDDGSTDNSLELLRRLTDGWPATVIEAQSNHGSAHATNRAIALAGLPYLKFVDADDLLAHDATDRLLQALHGSDACLAYGEAADYRSDAKPDLDAPLPPSPNIKRLKAPLKLAIKNSLFNPSQFLARTDCLREVGGCDERIVFGQDYTLTLRLAAKWDFLRVAALVAYLPEDAPGRVSEDFARELKDVTFALANFLRDNPSTPERTKRFACQRAAGRAWKYARRHLGARAGSEWYWLNVKSRLDLMGPAADFIERCATVYDRAKPAGNGTGAARK
ncbi:MAG TPA: glycosyltransferase family 2 protein [Alphaproteobacteria bacterium]|nr:glycosyltransferase family 2 protein [Alphaproteobacteria bacterium]